jgi:hypothetical protein
MREKNLSLIEYYEKEVKYPLKEDQIQEDGDFSWINIAYSLKTGLCMVDVEFGDEDHPYWTPEDDETFNYNIMEWVLLFSGMAIAGCHESVHLIQRKISDYFQHKAIGIDDDLFFFSIKDIIQIKNLFNHISLGYLYHYNDFDEQLREAIESYNLKIPLSSGHELQRLRLQPV